MSYISATAEIMYAPLDLRLVITGCRHHHRIAGPQKKRDAANRVSIRSTRIREKLGLAGHLGLLFPSCPSLRFQGTVDEVNHDSGPHQDEPESKRTHAH